MKQGYKPEKESFVGMKNYPLVTVITVTLNNGNLLERCIISVLNQTYPNIQYIVIDGDSVDNTPEILKKYESEIDVLVSEKDTGIYNAMNKGLLLSTGEYIIFLNADDWYKKSSIEELVNAGLKSRADITHANSIIVNNKNIVTGRLQASLHDGIYTRGATLRHETMLVKKRLYDDIGPYDESYKIISDYIFMIQAYSKGYKIQHLDRDLLFFNNTGISNVNNDLLLKERKRCFSGLFNFLDEEDLVVLSKDRNLSIEERLRLIKKYETKSELFARSMAFNISDTVASASWMCNISGCLDRLSRIAYVALRWIDNFIYLQRHMPRKMKSPR